MLPHFKSWTTQEKEAARRAFEEGSRQRTHAMQRQRPLTREEMLARLRQTQATAPAGPTNARG